MGLMQTHDLGAIPQPPGERRLGLGPEDPSGPPEGTSLFPAQLLGTGRTEQQD